MMLCALLGSTPWPDILRQPKEPRPSLDWFNALPPLPPEESNESVLINRGLPRTGTSSFAVACALVGMRTLHAGLRHCYPEPAMPPWTVTRTSPLTKACAIGYDAAADLPWFLGSRQDFARNAPWPTFFRFICTTRSSSSWTESMIPSMFNQKDKLGRMAKVLALQLPCEQESRSRFATAPRGL